MSKNLIAVVLALSATLGFAQNPPSSTSTSEIVAANGLIAKGDYAGAAAALEKIVAKDPGNKVAWRSLGFAYLKLKKMPESRAAYGKLLEIAPDTPQTVVAGFTRICRRNSSRREPQGRTTASR